MSEVTDEFSGWQDQLNAAAAGGGSGSGVSRKAHRLGSFYAGAVGLLIAAFLLVVVYLYPTHILWLEIPVTVAISAALIASCLWYRNERRASSPGWAKTYARSFTLSMTLYVVGVALSASLSQDAFWFWLPYAVLTALPLLLQGKRRSV
jgi:hypothetical protein